MKPKLYVETSIISYLAARPSRDVIINANQQLAHEWWSRRHDFELVISELVIDEVGKGDPLSAKTRLELIDGIPLIDFNEQARELSKEILRQNVLPPKATLDVFHIAVAVVHEIEFLLTLNCKHIANAFIFRRIEAICTDFGYQTPIVCTPQEILENEDPLND